MKNRRMLLPVMTVVLSLICLILGGALLAKSWKGETVQKIAEEEGALAGMLPGMSADEIQAELDRRVSENQLAISINSTLEFENGTSEGDIRVENSAKNHYMMVVEMYLNETGELIYRSGGIRPGYFLEKDRLDVELEKGDYPVTVHFKAYDDDNNYMGEANAETTIHIRN